MPTADAKPATCHNHTLQKKNMGRRQKDSQIGKVRTKEQTEEEGGKGRGMGDSRNEEGAEEKGGTGKESSFKNGLDNTRSLKMGFFMD